MSLKVTNPKSDKELAAHGYRDGKIIFNAGAETGPKASEYMFNEASMPIPGTNFQVKIKPQQTKEFDTAENSIQQIQIAQNAKDLDLEIVADVAPLQVTITTEDGETFTCDKTYEELKRYGNNVEVKLIIPDEGEINGVTTLPEGHFTYVMQNICYYGTAVIKNPNDINFYFPAGEGPIEEEYQFIVISIDSKNNVYCETCENHKDTNFYYVSWNGNEFVLNDLMVDENNSTYVVGFDKSVTSHIESLLVGAGYVKSATDYNFVDELEAGEQFAIGMNQMATLGGQYRVLVPECAMVLEEDGSNYEARPTNKNIIANYIHTSEKEGKAVISVFMKFSFVIDNNELKLNDIEPFVSDYDFMDISEQVYDASFSVTIDMDSQTQSGTVVCDTLPVFEDGKVVKMDNLSIASTDRFNVLDIYKPRNVYVDASGVLSDDFVTTYGLTIPQGSIFYMFLYCCGIIDDVGDTGYYFVNAIVYAEPGTTTWNACLSLLDH